MLIPSHKHLETKWSLPPPRSISFPQNMLICSSIGLLRLKTVNYIFKIVFVKDPREGSTRPRFTNMLPSKVQQLRSKSSPQLVCLTHNKAETLVDRFSDHCLSFRLQIRHLGSFAGVSNISKLFLRTSYFLVPVAWTFAWLFCLAFHCTV